MSSRSQRALIGLGLAVPLWSGALIPVFLFLVRDTDFNAPGKGGQAIAASVLTLPVLVKTVLRFASSDVRQEGEVIYVRNPFRTFEFKLCEASGYIDVERPGGAYTALVRRKDQRIVRLIGLPFPPPADVVDLGALPFVDILSRRNYW